MRGRPAGVAPKVAAVAEALAASIRSGDYLSSDLPSEAALAATHGVSYLTARRAVARVIADGLLTRTRGSRLELAQRAEARPLMVGWAVPTWSSFDVLRWQRALGEAAAACNAVLRPVLVSGWSDPALAAMARRADGLVAYPGDWGAPPEALVASTRMVVVDRASGHAAVPSLVANPPIAVDALLAALAGWGHRRIAWIGDPRSDRVIAARRERWLACGGGLELPCDRAAIAAAVRDRACDALLGAAMPQALLALRAARDTGTRVPEDVAVAVVNDEGLGDTLVPALCAPRCPDLAQWLGGALGWIAGEPWQQPDPSAPSPIERRETA